MKFRILFLLLMSSSTVIAQDKFYNLNLYEGKDYLVTLNQSNDIMLNGVRLIGNSIFQMDLSPKQKKIYNFGLGLFTSLFGQIITHEEGHRSALNELGIRSENNP